MGVRKVVLGVGNEKSNAVRLEIVVMTLYTNLTFSRRSATYL